MAAAAAAAFLRDEERGGNGGEALSGWETDRRRRRGRSRGEWAMYMDGLVYDMWGQKEWGSACPGASRRGPPEGVRGELVATERRAGEVGARCPVPSHRRRAREILGRRSDVA